MRPIRIVALGVAALVAAGCQDFPVKKDVYPKPAPAELAPPDSDQSTPVSIRDPQLRAFYTGYRPPRGFYVFRLISDPRVSPPLQVPLPAQPPRCWTTVIVRASDERLNDPNTPPAVRERLTANLPIVEKVINQICSVEDWHLLFALMRRYASSPPAGNYCWYDDCYGAFNQRTDGTGEGNFDKGKPPIGGQEIPGQPPSGGAGYFVSSNLPGGVVQAYREAVLYASLHGAMQPSSAPPEVGATELDLGAIKASAKAGYETLQKDIQFPPGPPDQTSLGQLKDQGRQFLKVVNP